MQGVHAIDSRTHIAQTPDPAGVVLASIATITAAQHVVSFLSIPVAAIHFIARAPMIIEPYVESMGLLRVILACMAVVVWIQTIMVTILDHQLLTLILQGNFLILVGAIAKHLPADPVVVGVMLKIGIGTQVMVGVELTSWAGPTNTKAILGDLAWFKYLGYNVV